MKPHFVRIMQALYISTNKLFGRAVPYRLVVLWHEEFVSDNVPLIWDSDDTTCFSMPSEVNETLGSVRIYLDRPVDGGLTRVVSEPRPNVVYYLLANNSNGFPTAEQDDIQDNVWIYSGEPSYKVRGVDIHSVTRLCEVSVFNISDKTDLPPRTSKQMQAGETRELSWELILCDTLLIVFILAVASLLYWKRRNLVRLCSRKVPGLPPEERPNGPVLPVTADDEEDIDDTVTFATDDTAALFHSRISPRAGWLQPSQADGRADHSHGSNPDVISDIAFVNHLLEHEYATLEPPMALDDVCVTDVKVVERSLLCE